MGDVLGQNALEHCVEALDEGIARVVKRPLRVQEHQRLRIQRPHVEIVRIRTIDLRHRLTVGAVQHRPGVRIVLLRVPNGHGLDEGLLDRVVGLVDPRHRLPGGLVRTGRVRTTHSAVHEGAAGLRLAPVAHGAVRIPALRFLK